MKFSAEPNELGWAIQKEFRNDPPQDRRACEGDCMFKCSFIHGQSIHPFICTFRDPNPPGLGLRGFGSLQSYITRQRSTLRRLQQVLPTPLHMPHSTVGDSRSLKTECFCTNGVAHDQTDSPREWRCGLGPSSTAFTAPSKTQSEVIRAPPQ